MRFNNLSEDEILDYIMTNDLNEELTLPECIFLLKFIKRFYRLQCAKNEQFSILVDELRFKLENQSNLAEQNANSLMSTICKIKASNEELLERKLTFRERILGKIKQENGNR